MKLKKGRKKKYVKTERSSWNLLGNELDLIKMNGKRSLNQQIKNIVYADGNAVREKNEKKKLK